jgi:hypothetical protein
MRANTTLTRQVALLSIIAMAGVALSTGVAAADHQVGDKGVEISAPDAVETGEDITIEANVPEDAPGAIAIKVELETSEGSAVERFTAESGTYKGYTVSTDGLGQASGEATVTAKSYFGPNAEVFATETVTLEEPGQEESLPPWAQFLPGWFIEFLKIWGYL